MNAFTSLLHAIFSDAYIHVQANIFFPLLCAEGHLKFCGESFEILRKVI